MPAVALHLLASLPRTDDARRLARWPDGLAVASALRISAELERAPLFIFGVIILDDDVRRTVEECPDDHRDRPGGALCSRPGHQALGKEHL